MPKWLEKPAVTVGSCTFGIYLIEQILRERGYPVRDAIAPWLGALPSTLIYTGLVLTAAFCIIWVLRKFPGIRQLL